MEKPRLTVSFLNFGHALDHLSMLIYPTVILAMTAEFGGSYGDLLRLSFGGFVAFGAGALPAGWLADRWGRPKMLIVFFIGLGAALILTGLARTPTEIAVGLTLIGVFASIYHPVGIAMLVADPERIGRRLGVNGLLGNFGVAFAAILAGALSDLIDWRAAFILPGAISIAGGIGFAILVPRAPASPASGERRGQRLSRDVMIRVFLVLTIITLCSGMIFNATTIAMPKLFEERLSALTESTFGIGALVSAVYVLAALAQLLVGQLIDKISLKTIFLPLALLQVPLKFLAGSVVHYPMLALAVVMMFVVFGLIPIGDALVARYTDERWRSRVFAVRFVGTFGAAAAAVPLVGTMHEATGGFEQFFVVLAVLALVNLAPAFFFPKRHPAPAGPEAALP